MHFQGLSEKEVQAGQKQFGPNAIEQVQKDNALTILAKQFKSPIIYLLSGTAIVTMLFGEWTDAILIMAVLVFDIAFGFYQEYNASKTLHALKQMIDPQTTVIRAGKRIRVSTKELVPGDLAVLGPGDIVPADGKLLNSVNLLIKEAILTGEQEAIPKSDQGKDSKVFMGTSVLSGNGVMQVTGTGKQTEFGKIGLSLLTMDEQETPLQLQLEKFSKSLTLIVLVISIIIFGAGIARENSIWDSLRFAIVLAIAAIPEGLPIVVTVILSLGMKRILKEKGLVKNLLSVETLGSTTVICTDKTGTLTEGNMKVVITELTHKESLMKALVSNNDQRTNMEVALFTYAKSEEMPIDDYFESNSKFYDEPFSSETKYHFSIWDDGHKKTAYLTGAPEFIMSACNLADDEKKRIKTIISDWANKGLRVIAAAYKDSGDLKKKEQFSLSGLIGIDDPIRDSAKASLEQAARAGIKVKIITGDYRKTAVKIAHNLGLTIADENIMEGTELDKISLSDLRKKIGSVILFARVSPQHKLKIIEALQKNGEVVAMTGDGVNDVLALKKADIGIAMGNSSDVAKEAADLILLDNDFQTIVSTCEEGRLVYLNIKKVIGYILSNSFAEIILITIATLLGLPVPLLVAQILWIHLICDGPPDIILGFDHDKTGLLDSPPKDHRKEQIFDRKLRTLVGAVSTSIALLGTAIYLYYLNNGGVDLARTMVFAFLCMISLIYIFSYKDLNRPLWKMRNLGENKLLFGAILYGIILTVSALYLPFLNIFLNTQPIGLEHWIVIMTASVFVTGVVELVKKFRFKEMKAV